MLRKRRMRMWKRLGRAVIIAGLLSLVAGSSVSLAQATPNQIESSPKGMFGLGLIGAELGLVLPTLAGLDETWSLITFPVVGAAGGAVAGYFLIDSNNYSELSVALLAFGVAMVVPALVLTRAMTAYDPDEDAGGTEAEPDEAEPAEAGASASGPPARVRRAQRLARAGSGLLRLSEEGLLLAAPGISILSTQAVDGTGPSFRISLFSGVF